MEDKVENYQLYLIDFGLSSSNPRATSTVHDEETAVDLYVLQRALISATEIRGSNKDADFTPEAFFESVLAAYAEAYPAEVVARPNEVASTTGAPQQQSQHGKKRARLNFTSSSSTHEDGVKEVNGILRNLKEVQARGRKRLMIG